MNTLLSMCIKDLRLLVRDRMGFFFALFFPLITAIFFGTIFSAGGDSSSDPDKKMKVLLVDSDRTAASRKFAARLEAAEEFGVTGVEKLDEATELIRRGNGYVAAVHIPAGYGEASERMFWGEPPVLEVYTDPSRKAEIGMFEGLLTKYAFMRMQEMFTNPSKFIPSTKDALAQLNGNAEMDPKAKAALQQFLPNLETFLGNMPETGTIGDAEGKGTDGTGGGLGSWQPVKITSKAVQAAGQKGPPSGFAVTFPQGIMWGVLGCSLAMAVSLVTERTRGTLVRLRMAPVSRWRVLAGKGLTCFVLIMVMGTMLIGVGLLPMFRVHPVSPMMLVLGLASTAACFTGLMMLVASLGKTEAAAGGLGWSIMLVMSMIGGGMVPLFVMPGWLQKLSDVSPVKWGILAIEGGVWRGFTLGEMLTPCAVLVGVGVAGFVVGVGVLRRNA